MALCLYQAVRKQLSITVWTIVPRGFDSVIGHRSVDTPTPSLTILTCDLFVWPVYDPV